MPILDHFHAPLSVERTWNTFHHAWAATIARQLNRRLLPENYFAAPNIRFGSHVEIDVAALEESSHSVSSTSVAMLVATVPPPTVTVPAVFPDTIEVVIFNQEGGPQVVAAIELVSPANKDRPESRRGFVAKMSTYLQQGIALAVIDLVTSREAHLHNEWIQWTQAPAGSMNGALYANSYRPVQRDGRAEIDMWLHALQIADPLPNLPLYLRPDVVVDVPLEETYLETCEDQRIAVF